MKKLIVVVAATILVEVLVFVIFIHTGLYNVSAASPDSGVMRWVFSTTSDNSIQHQARGIVAPDLTDTSMNAEGFDHYNEMCVGCHGAPGIDRSEIGVGLNPSGPDLTESAKELTPPQLFWVVKNGIKSTGMPSFAKTHSDQKIWAMVAFLERMKTMSAIEYKSLQKSAVKEEESDSMPGMDMSGHDHEHGK